MMAARRLTTQQEHERVSDDSTMLDPMAVLSWSVEHRRCKNAKINNR